MILLNRAKRNYLFTLLAVLSMNTYSTNSYLPPDFADANRLAKIQKLFPKIDDMYRSFAEKNHVPGYAFGIMVDGKLIYTGSGGYSNLETKQLASPQSMFRIASMTKSFTALAILQLRDDGKLQLDDPVSQYVPEIKEQRLTQDGPIITIRNLLIHAAGLPQDDPWGDRQLSMSKGELQTLVADGVSFANTPGVAYEYSNLGYSLLGMVITKASGMPYQEYIAKTIWQPLAMQDSGWEFAKIPPGQLAQGYKWFDNQWHKEELLNDGTFGAMGGMITSIESFSHYVALHQMAWPPRDESEQGLIKRRTLREMHQPSHFVELDLKHHFLDGEQCPLAKAYGYGLTWTQDCEKKNYVGHSGGLPGFGSNWLMLPDYGIAVIFFANNTYTFAAQINMYVSHRIVKDAELQPRQIPLSPLLQERQTELMKLLPTWEGAEASRIFAMNFFLDSSITARKKESDRLFKKAGKIIQVNKMIPENQLRGHFIIHCEQVDLKVQFTLTPEKIPLIQEYEITEVTKTA